MTLPKEVPALVKEWVAKNPGKICGGAEHTALLTALKEVSPLLLPFPQCTRAHPPIPRSLQLLLQLKKPGEDERTDKQLKNLLKSQLSAARQTIIRPQQHGSTPKRKLGELSASAPDAIKARNTANNPENYKRARIAIAAANFERNAELTAKAHAGDLASWFGRSEAPCMRSSRSQANHARVSH
jgi:hypothetical protein